MTQATPDRRDGPASLASSRPDAKRVNERGRPSSMRAVPVSRSREALLACNVYFEPLPEEPAPVVPPPVLVPLPVSREPEPLLLVPVPEPPLGEEASRSLDDEPEEPDAPDREPAVWASSSLPPVMDMTCCLCCWSLGRIAVANCFTSWSFAFFDFSEYAATPFAWLTFM